jgi:hypothetical protein
MSTDDEMTINECRKYLHKTINDIGNPHSKYEASYWMRCKGPKETTRFVAPRPAWPSRTDMQAGAAALSKIQAHLGKSNGGNHV